MIPGQNPSVPLVIGGPNPRESLSAFGDPWKQPPANPLNVPGDPRANPGETSQYSRLGTSAQLLDDSDL